VVGHNEGDMAHLCKLAISTSLALSVMGCASFEGVPAAVSNAPLGVVEFKAIETTGLIGRADPASFEGKTLALARNEWVSLQRVIVDQTYDKFEKRLSGESRGIGFGTNIATLGLTTVATASGAEGVKTATAALATALVGGQQSFGKDVLIDRTLTILVTQMRANRNATLAKIIERRNLPYEKWTIGDAQGDLQAYYAAGTLQGALTAVAETAAASNAESKRAVDIQISAPFDQTSDAELLRNYFEVKDDIEYKRRRTLGFAQLKKLGISGVPPLMFVDQTISDVQKARFIKLLIENETSSDARAELISSTSKTQK
jgi:hypothetical protein